MSVTAKSVIIDIADNRGDLNYLALRSVDFYLNGALVDVVEADFTAYATTEFNSSYLAKNVFITALSKTGTKVGTSWHSTSGNLTEQRLIIVFDTATEFDEVRVSNHHHSATEVIRGVKNVVITASSDTITSTVYEDTITNATVLYDGLILEHYESDTADVQVVYESTPTPPTAFVAKSVVFDIADNHGGSWIGIRSIEFWMGGSLVLLHNGWIPYATSQYSASFTPSQAFDTSKSKTGSAVGTCWMASSSTDQRLTIVFELPIEFDTIIINNYHNSGGDTDRGFNNVVITASDDAITSTTYEDTITNATVLYDGVFAEHAATDTVDDETVWEFQTPDMVVHSFVPEPLDFSYVTLSGTVKNAAEEPLQRKVYLFSGVNFGTLLDSTISAADGTFSFTVTGFPKDKFSVLAAGENDENTQVYSNISEI